MTEPSGEKKAIVCLADMLSLEDTGTVPLVVAIRVLEVFRQVLAAGLRPCSA